MKFQFLPRKAYKNQYNTDPGKILHYFEDFFLSRRFQVVLSSVIKDKKLNIESDKNKRSSKKKAAEDFDDEGQEAPDKTMDQLEKGGFGEGHASSDEEDLPDDADATEARKKSRQADDDHAEEMSDEEVDMVRNLDKELGDDIPDFSDGEESDGKARASAM